MRAVLEFKTGEVLRGLIFLTAVRGVGLICLDDGHQREFEIASLRHVSFVLSG